MDFESMMPEKPTSFLKNMSQAFSEAQNDLSMQNAEYSLEYQRRKKQYDQVFEEIRDKLGDKRKLMLKLERLQNELDFIDSDYIYLQGFIDCVSLLKLIRLI